jgi:hypothetical protein
VTKFLSDFIFAMIVFGVLCAAPAHAYLDSASISLALQALTGAIASWLVFGKTYWSKIVGFLRRKSASAGNEHQD